MRIEQASASEAEAAWAVVRRCVQALQAAGSDQWDDHYPSRAVLDADVAAQTLFVLKDGEQVRGVVCLNEEQDPAYAALPWRYDGRVLVIHRLCIDPEAQGQGLGRRLLAFCEAYGRAQGYACIRLDAYTGNPAAITFYERSGYERVGQTRFPRRALPFDGFEKRLVV